MATFTRSRRLVLALAAATILATGCAVPSDEVATDPFGTAQQGSSTTAAPTPPPATTEPVLETEPSESAPTGPIPDIEGDGVWLVGTDVQPGVYVAPTIPRYGCYWERLKGLSGAFRDLVANDNVDGQAIVEIKPNDKAFSSNDCGPWYALDKNDRTPGTTIPGDGNWAVGVDIQPGVYRNEGKQSCYWERTSNFAGDFNAIKANDNVSGPAVVEIKANDAGFTSSDCGAWELIG